MSATRSSCDTGERAPDVSFRGANDFRGLPVEDVAQLNMVDAQVQHVLGAAAADAPHSSTHFRPVRAARHALEGKK